MTDDEAITLATLHAGGPIKYGGWDYKLEFYNVRVGEFHMTVTMDTVSSCASSLGDGQSILQKLKPIIARDYCRYHGLSLE